MKKVLCFAAMAMAIFASCQKTEIVGNNDGPQEIGIFAINKTPTKAPVEKTEFPTEYGMAVSAYLAKVDGGISGVRNYFTNCPFTYADATATWTGNQYWPLSDAVMNFHAIAPVVENVITTTFTNTTNCAETSVTEVKNNETSQYDVMYAVARGTKENNTSTAVDMKFKHAYCWLDFNFNTSADAPTITINSITVNNVACNGELTVSATNMGSALDGEPVSAKASWKATATNINVPASTLTLSTTPTEFEKGILLIPSSDTKMTSFVINYTMGTQTLNYTYTAPSDMNWEEGKRYIYNISMLPTKISISPSVQGWDGDNEGNQTNNEGNQTNNDSSLSLN